MSRVCIQILSVVSLTMFKTSLIYVIAGVLAAFLQYITLPMIVKNVSIEQFGVISLLETVVTMSMTLITCSIERAAQRFNFDPLHERSIVFSNCLMWIIASGVVYTAVAFLLEYLKLIHSPLYPFSLPLMIFAGLSAGILNLVNVFMQTNEKPVQYLIINFLKGLFQLGFVFYFIKLCKLGIGGYVLSTVLTSILLICTSLVSLPKIAVRAIRVDLIKEMLVFSLPMVPTVLAAWLVSMQGRFFLTKYATLADVGGYFFWFKITLLYFLCSSTISAAITPTLFRALSQGRTVPDVLDAFVKPLMKIYGLVGVVFVIISGDLARLMGGELYHIQRYMIALMISGYFTGSIMACGSDVMLSYFKQTKLQMTAFLLGGAVSLLANIVMTPYFKVLGVILASVLGVAVIFIFHYGVFRKKQFKFRVVLEAFAWCAVIVLTGVLVDQAEFLPETVWQFLRVGVFSVSLVTCIFILHQIKIFDEPPAKLEEN